MVSFDCIRKPLARLKHHLCFCFNGDIFSLYFAFYCGEKECSVFAQVLNKFAYSYTPIKWHNPDIAKPELVLGLYSQVTFFDILAHMGVQVSEF